MGVGGRGPLLHVDGQPARRVRPRHHSVLEYWQAVVVRMGVGTWVAFQMRVWHMLMQMALLAPLLAPLLTPLL